MRFAPLINMLYGLVGLGEGIGRIFLGDAKGAADSFFVSVGNITSVVLSYAIPYFFRDSENEINAISAILNLCDGIYIYFSQLNKPSNSLTYTFSPILHMIQIGTNSLEVYQKK
ncbi:MAG: hypothetical protein QXQ77_01935 [Candidatus Aenigmatarchaeota archaeon]